MICLIAATMKLSSHKHWHSSNRIILQNAITVICLCKPIYYPYRTDNVSVPKSEFPDGFLDYGPNIQYASV